MAIPIAAAMILAAGIGGVSSAAGQWMANQESARSTQAQMDFQERMSNTQYQRAIADMKRAGINPMLAYQQGGAGTPSGASYQAGNVGAAGMEGAESGLSTARSAKMFEQEYDLKGAEVDIANQTARNLIDQRKLIQAQTVASGAQAARESATTAILHEDLATAKAAAAAAKQDEEFYKSEGGKFLRNVERVTKSILPGSQTVRNVR